MMIAESPPIQHVLERIADEYGFESVTVERELSGGMFARPVLLQTDRGPFVRRIHTFRNTEQAFRFQAETIESAWLQGIRCSRVEPTLDGKWCVPCHRQGVVSALHRFVEGTCDDWLAWHRRKETDDGFLHSLGYHIAELHNALAISRPGGDPTLNIDLPPIQFCQLNRVRAAWRTAIDRLQQQTGIACADSKEQLLSRKGRIEAHWERLIIAASRYPLDALPRQIVHGDISAVNIVFDTADRMTLIDWDCVHIGHRMYDAIGDILNRPPDDRPDWYRFNQGEVDVFLDGYASGAARPLEDRERDLVPAFCLARQLEDLRQRLYTIPCLEASKDERYARLINMRIDMMDQISLN